jgi:trypsin
MTTTSSNNNDDTRHLIIGGSDVLQGRYPYMAEITNSTGHNQCGGTLIAPDIVLTAAHCASVIHHGGDIQVGHYSKTTNHDYYIETFTVKRQVVHPSYSTRTMLRYDFLLLFLDRPSSHDPIRMINDDIAIPSVDGMSLHVMGWGRTNPFSPLTSSVLQEVEVKYVPNEKCVTSAGYIGPVIGTYHGLIQEDHICATDIGEDACYGDSGSPLIIKGHDENGDMDVLVGIVSWGFACVHNDFPGVYGRVSLVYDWIRNNACASEHAQDLFDCNPPDGVDHVDVDDASNEVKTSSSDSHQDESINPSLAPIMSEEVKEENFIPTNNNNNNNNQFLASPFCSKDDPCPSNSICIDSKCKKENGQECLFHVECLYNKCSSDTGKCINGGLLSDMPCIKNNQCTSRKCKNDVCVNGGSHGSKKRKKTKKR